MLVLRREIDETIVLADAAGNVLATIMVVEFRRDGVRLGVTADRSITIDRGEVWTKRVAQLPPQP